MNNKEFRLSDSDRNDAMNQLARAVGEGRLSVEEFEERSDNVMRATFGRDLVPVLKDIPSVRNTEIKEFSRSDIERLRKDGQKTPPGSSPHNLTGRHRRGTVSHRGFRGKHCWNRPWPSRAFSRAHHLDLALRHENRTRFLAHPSLRQLERERKRELGSKRQDKLGQLTDEALGIAQRQLSKWNKK